MQPKLTPTSFPGDYDVEQGDIARRRALSSALTDFPIPDGQMVSGHYVSPGWAGALAKILQGFMKGQNNAALTKEEKSLAERRSQAAAQWFEQMPQGTPGRAAIPMSRNMETGEDMGPAMAAQPPTAPSRGEIASWATKGTGISPMTNNIASAAVAKMISGDTRKMELSEIFDEATGQPMKVWVDPQNPGMPPVPVGGTKKPSNDSKEAHARQIEYLMEHNGMDRAAATELVYGMRKYLAAGENAIPVNNASLYPGGVAPGAARGAPPAATGMPPAAPQPAPPMAGGATTQPAPAGGPSGALVGPYAPKAAPPGTIRGDPGNRAGQEKLSNDVEKYGRYLTENGVAQLDQKLSDVENMIKRYEGKNIPGVGYGANLPISALLSNEAQDVQNTIRHLRGQKVRAEAGLSQTAKEIENVLAELGLNVTQGESVFRKAIPRLRAALNAHRGAIDRTYDPQVVNLYNSRGAGGMSEEERARQAMGGM